MHRAIGWAALLAVLAPWSAAAAVEEQDLSAALRQLDTGDWNARIRTVHELEYMQDDGLPVLTVAAQDGDWQVRMAAVHALAPLGPKATPILKAVLMNEPCPVVRLIALHDLGSKAAEGDEEKELGWIFSATTAQVNACRDQPEPGRAPWAGGLPHPALRPRASAAKPKSPAAAPRRPAPPEAPPQESNEAVITADVPKPAAAPPAPKAEAPSAAPTRNERYAELDAMLAEPAPENLPGPSAVARRANEPAAGVSPRTPPARPGAGEASVTARRTGPDESLPRPVVTTAAPEKPVAAPAAFEAAGSKAPHDAVPDLILALQKGSVASRARAADELGSRGAAAAPAVPVLMAALKDKNPRVRASASLALGNIGVDDKTVVPLLVKALKDKNLDVRYAAALALSRAGTPEARAAFKKRLDEDARREIDQ